MASIILSVDQVISLCEDGIKDLRKEYECTREEEIQFLMRKRPWYCWPRRNLSMKQATLKLIYYPSYSFYRCKVSIFLDKIGTLANLLESAKRAKELGVQAISVSGEELNSISYL